MRANTEQIRNFIINNIEAHPVDISGLVAQKFDVSTQAANAHLRALVEDNILVSTGKTKGKRYGLFKKDFVFNYKITPDLSEDRVWRSDIEPFVASFADNVQRIWMYCFSEIFNNAIDHSEGNNITVKISQDVLNTRIVIQDDGIGIFNKVSAHLGIDDLREVVTEIAKGKFTTDKQNHTGEGIFFTSRMVDVFFIWSYKISWMHFFDKADWVFDENTESEYKGTSVSLKLANKVDRTTKEIFNKFGNPDFDSTVIPVVLMDSSSMGLVSRSQARRLLSRLESFKNVVLDFKGVSEIGQAFADEIFRVFPLYHPDVKISAVNTTSDVASMIQRALNK